MIDYLPLYARLPALGLGAWCATLPALVAARLDPAHHGDLDRWYAALAALPHHAGATADLTAACLRVSPELSDGAQAQLREALQGFHPWRKGPFCIHGVHVDTEWRSDWKWNRVRPHLDLRGKLVLDVGCGNGYYGWRMVGAGAACVIGVDPTLLYVMQYAAVRHFVGDSDNYVLPLRLEDIPPVAAFDALFSMGVLYHRRDPLEHLDTLRRFLRPGGQVILETLVIEGGVGEVLYPGERYAKMKNVWAIPSVAAATEWLQEAGFCDVACVDVTRTTVAEQRTTEWMRFESLPDFLDPADPSRTREGHPAPVRALFIASV